MTAEFSRIVQVARIRESTHRTVEANAAECDAVAARLSLNAVRYLRCGFDLCGAEAGVVLATGMLRARVTRTCVISLEPFETEVAEDFRVRFVPAGTESDDIDLEADDEIPYEDAALDLGEAAAEQLALALEPFPRKPGAELPEVSEQENGPFAALARLRGY
jgi:uncharacterized metal-binding protein YceD (DUF177 family)